MSAVISIAKFVLGMLDKFHLSHTVKIHDWTLCLSGFVSFLWGVYFKICFAPAFLLTLLLTEAILLYAKDMVFFPSDLWQKV